MIPSCPQVRDAAPELALGILSGTERADVLAHLDSCAGCRSYAAQLSVTADSLVLLAPESEPPAGFERRATTRLAAARGQRRFPGPRVLVSAAAVVAATMIATLALVRILDTGGSRPLPATVREATMIGAGGQRAGHAFVVRSNHTLALLTVTYALPAGRYGVEAVSYEGHTRRVGSVRIAGGEGTWSGTLPGGSAPPAVLRLVRGSNVVCEARFAGAPVEGPAPRWTGTAADN